MDASTRGAAISWQRVIRMLQGRPGADCVPLLLSLPVAAILKIADTRVEGPSEQRRTWPRHFSLLWGLGYGWSVDGNLRRCNYRREKQHQNKYYSANGDPCRSLLHRSTMCRG